MSPGFFGKITTNGDFVSRRLPASFITPWDQWLQQGLLYSRELLTDCWLNCYLTSPVWRFAFSSTIFDGISWGGVLMPSVDKVGRYFPLTIASGAPGEGHILDWLTKNKDWYDKTEDIARSTLQHDCVFDNFNIEVLAMPGLPSYKQLKNSASLAGINQFFESMDETVKKIDKLTLTGYSLWWSELSPNIQSRVMVCQGLPKDKMFAALFMKPEKQ